MKRERNQRIGLEDRGTSNLVHNGKVWVNLNRQDESVVGLKWGEIVKTRKPCTKGANKATPKRK